MRKIKFRVWDKKKNRWFHGSTDPARIATSTDAISLFGEVIIFGELMVDQNNEEAVSLDRLNDLVALQYTGLKDKNGREIYEGDVVQWKYREYQPKQDVRFAEGSFGVQTTVGHVPLIEYLHQDLEIIGNIYENPELLQKGKAE